MMTMMIMELINNNLNFIKYGVGTSVATVITIIGFMKYRRSSKLKSLRAKWNANGKDVVILHQFPRAITAPNLSPYPIKLELYLRINNIKYVVDNVEMMSAKGKSPWITLNDVDVADSQLAMEYLNNHFKIDMDNKLTDLERATSRAFRALIEDNLYFCLALHRWVYEEGKHNHLFFPPFGPKWMEKRIFKQVSNKIKEQANGQGLGRHSREDVETIGIKDIQAISQLLGKNEYMMGKNEPTELDLVVFGFIAMIIYCSEENNIYVLSLNKFTNLKEHNMRMREKYFSDWPVYQKKN